MTQTPRTESYQWNWRICFLTGVDLWQRDKLFVVMFVIVNLLLGQIGVIASLIFAADSPLATVLGVLKSNFSAAALYTFAITLLTGALAGLAIEIIDKSRKNESVVDFEYKMFWFFVALLLIVLQSTVAGNLIARTSLTKPESSSSTAFNNEIQRPPTSTNNPANEDSDLKLPVATSTLPPGLKEANTKEISYSAILQTFFWLLSMITAFELFSLQRRDLAPNSYIKTRKKEVDALAEQAQKAESTSFGETI